MIENETLILRCGACGTKNRAPRNKLNEKPLCGKCGSPIYSDFSASPVDVTDETFNDVVLFFKGPVILDCWAPWCGPCRMVAPVLDQLAYEYAGKIKIAKLNVDENKVTASKYSIQSIPTMLLFKSGKQVERIVGALPKPDIERYINSLLLN